MPDANPDPGRRIRASAPELSAATVAAGVFLAYFAAGTIGLSQTGDHGIATLVWPPSGIALAAALLFGFRRVLPAVFAAHLGLVISVHGWMDGIAAVTGGVLLSGAALGAGACLQTWAAAALARRYADFPHRLTDPSATAKFLILTGPVACLVTALLGPSILIAGGLAPLSDWANAVLIWWAGGTVGAVIFGPIVILLFLGPGDSGNFRQYFVAATLFAIFLVLAAVHMQIGERSRDSVLAHFRDEANDLALTFRSAIGDGLGVLRSIDVTRHAIGGMGPEPFAAFARLYFEMRPDLAALSWSGIYRAGQRRDAETQLRKNYGTDIRLAQMNADGTIGALDNRAEFVTVMMTETRDGNRAALGFDMSSIPAYRTAIEKARMTGAATATGKVPFLPGDEDEPAGIFVFWPHFVAAPGRRGSTTQTRVLAGFHIGLFQVGESLERLQTARAGQNFSFRLTDISADGSKGILQEEPGESDLMPSGHAAAAVAWAFPMPFADRTWELQISLRSDALRAALAGRRSAMIFPGVLITILLAYLLLMISSRSSELAALVRTRTRELADANRLQANLLQKYTESETRLEAAQRIARFGSWEWDVVTGEIVAFSDECARIYGVQPESLRTRFPRIEHLIGQIHPEDRETAERSMRTYAALADSSPDLLSPLEIEYRIRRADGETRYLSQIVEPHFDGENGRRRLLATIHDITQQRQAAELLRQSEERLRQATQLAGLGHFIRNPKDATFQFCSREYAQIFGLSVADYLAGAASEDGRLLLVHPDDRDAYVAARQALRNGNPITLAYRALTVAGETRHVREMIRPVLDATGAVVQEIGVGQDVTAIEMSEEQLRQSHKMEALGKLTGGVAHDFNNLLFIIKGNVDLLIRKLGNSEPLVSEILIAADRAEQLTRQLLAFSRRQPLNPQPVDLNPMLVRMSNLLHLTLGEAVKLEIACAADVAPVMIDRTQMENALLNIAINARDAMAAGGTLTIRCRDLDLGPMEAKSFDIAQGRYVVLDIADTGTGMSADIRQRAFEPFFTTKEIGSGSGLGLSMVYGFARQSGGHAAIASEEGKGTTVSLLLPQADRHGTAEIAPCEPAPQGNGEMVLLVEDDPSVRAVTQRMLEALGYRVLCAAQGEEALEKVAGTNIDLILSDVALPGGMSGPEFVRRAVADAPGIAVVFFSGYPDEVIRAEGPLNGTAPLLRKPVSRSTLGVVLSESLQKARAGAPRSDRRPPLQ